MKITNKFIAGVVLGAAAGIAIALLLKSDKGQELLTKVKEGVQDLGDNIKAKWQTCEEEAITSADINNEASS